MAGQTDFNLQEYLRAIGSRGGGGDYQFSTRVTPTVQLADFSDLTPAHQPPLAIYGGIVPVPAATFGALQVHSRGKGGAFILDLAWHSGIFIPNQFAISATGLALNNVVNHIGQLASDEMPLTTIQSGDLPGVLATTFPAFISNSFPNGIWIPPGQFCTVVSTAVATTTSFACTISDVPVSQGGD